MAAQEPLLSRKYYALKVEAVNTDIEVTKKKLVSNILDAICYWNYRRFKISSKCSRNVISFIAFIAMINYTLEKLDFGQV